MENPRALRRCQETQLQGREKPKARRVVRYVPSPPPKGLLEAGSVLMPCEGQVKKTENGSVLGMRKGVLTTVGIIHKKI
jgi:hypothetical protein